MEVVNKLIFNSLSFEKDISAFSVVKRNVKNRSSLSQLSVV
jgi:hypothetical protein